MEGRLARARLLAARQNVRPAAPGRWSVRSQDNPNKKYTVNVHDHEVRCNCPDFGLWELPCKHIFAVRYHQGGLNEVSEHDEQATMRPSYPQDWPAYNSAQINEKDHFLVLLHDLCSGIANTPQRLGRPRLPLADVIYACTMKVYTTVSGRRASSDIRECKAKGHIDVAPHHNSISTYLQNEALTPILKELIEQSALPLKALEQDFAIDSTGFSTSVYSRWFDHKWGREKKKQRWLKAHAMVGVRTNVVTSVEITEGNVADVSELPDLVKATARNFTVNEVSADKAYLSNKNVTAIERAGGTPFIVFKSRMKNSGKNTPAWDRMWHLFWFQRDEFEKRYHKRSNVETTFSMIKRKFGGNVRSKRYESQVNELLCKILAHNIVVVVHEMYELGIDPRLGPDGKVLQ